MLPWLRVGLAVRAYEVVWWSVCARLAAWAPPPTALHLHWLPAGACSMRSWPLTRHLDTQPAVQACVVVVHRQPSTYCVLPAAQIFEKHPTMVKNYGIWLRYQSRTGYHNMYKEYRSTTLNDAVSQMYQVRPNCTCCVLPGSTVRHVAWFEFGNLVTVTTLNAAVSQVYHVRLTAHAACYLILL